MKSSPLVSVITPTYNRAEYLAETIESVLAQDFSDFEYIVLDDGSTDHTHEILNRYKDRILWETHTNMGEARTVNKGLEMARGDFIVIVNSDDPVRPGFLKTMSEYLRENPHIEVAYPDWYKINEHSQKISDAYRRDFNYEWMLRKCICLVGPGAFIRRHVFEREQGRDPQYRYVGDFDQWLRLGLHGAFARVPEVLATHRVHPGSATVAQRGLDMAEEHIRMYERLFTRNDLSPSVRNARPEALSTIYYMAGAQAIRESYRTARQYFIHSFRLAPSCYLTYPQRLVYLLSVIFLPASLQQHLFHLWKNK